jgi:membrane protein DedA with SNARE-associated domain
MLETVLILLKKYGYTFILPLSIVEGPILTVLCGFLVTMGVFNPIIVYLVVLFGDVLGDSGAYLLGLLSKKNLANQLEKFFGITEAKIETVKYKMLHHKYKTLISSKLFHGIGVTGLFVAGVTRFPYFLFLIICTTVSIFQSAIFLFIGIIFGHFYVIIDSYLNQYVMIMGILLIAGIVIVFLRRGSKKIL